MCAIIHTHTERDKDTDTQRARDKEIDRDEDREKRVLRSVGQIFLKSCESKTYYVLYHVMVGLMMEPEEYSIILPQEALSLLGPVTF